jgi:hypothetical protein
MSARETRLGGMETARELRNNGVSRDYKEWLSNSSVFLENLTRKLVEPSLHWLLIRSSRAPDLREVEGDSLKG